MILDRQVEGRRGAGAATATSMSLRVVMVGRGEGELADIDWEQAWLEQRVISVDDYEAALAAYAARAAIPSDGHRFTVAVKAPPRITFLTTGISYPNPPAKPDRNPIIVATGPFCLLVQFSAVPPRDPARFYYFNPPLGHLVVVRGFFGGADGRVGGDAVLVPDRGDNIPKRVARDVDTVGFLCDDKDGSYVIAELKVDSAADSSQNAVLICYRSVLGAWSTKRMEAPPSRRTRPRWTATAPSSGTGRHMARSRSAAPSPGMICRGGCSAWTSIYRNRSSDWTSPASHQAVTVRCVPASARRTSTAAAASPRATTYYASSRSSSLKLMAKHRPCGCGVASARRVSTGGSGRWTSR